jgi:RNA polymerase sigma factor (sigma-70 family)
VTGSDAELVRAAWSGDATALGSLLARHRAGMRAVALSLLGYGPDADDAVQDACLVALGHVGDLRDPDAVGPWLRTVVRNACLMRLRQSRTVPLDGPTVLTLPTREPGPDEVVERQALRDWVWHALGELSEPLRLAVVLRYFGPAWSYEQIAALCGVPVGTVRSRLNQARARLADALLATVGAAHDDVSAITAARRREAEEFLAASRCGELAAALADVFTPAAEVIAPQGQRGGLHLLAHIMDSDRAAGVGQRITGVVAGRDVTIWEADLLSPPDDPTHCPPSVVWLQILREGRVHRLRLYHPRPARTSPPARASGR